jgi:hypothetical protein
MAPRTFGLSDGSLPELTSRQFWLAALEVGITKDGLISLLHDSYDGNELEYLTTEIRESTSFRRDYPLISEIAILAGINEIQLDALWLRAAGN